MSVCGLGGGRNRRQLAICLSFFRTGRRQWLWVSQAVPRARGRQPTRCDRIDGLVSCCNSALCSLRSVLYLATGSSRAPGLSTGRLHRDTKRQCAFCLTEAHRLTVTTWCVRRRPMGQFQRRKQAPCPTQPTHLLLTRPQGGATPLMAASAFGRLEVFEQLIAAGADPAALDQARRSFVSLLKLRFVGPCAPLLWPCGRAPSRSCA